MPNWKKLITSGSDATLNSLNLSGIVNAGTDTDKFLVLDSSGNVDFRTGANVLSDIGASATSHNHTLDSLSNTTITSNTPGEILKWNGSAWVNNTLAEAGIQAAGSYLTTVDLTSDVTGQLPIANGGTAAANASDARSNLGLAIGSDVQAWSNILSTVAAQTYAGSTATTILGSVSTGEWLATDIGLAHGGTGASLADPNDDRILFWDDSAGSVAWLDIGTGLSITNQTISATGGGGSGYEWFDGTTYATASVDISITGSVGVYKSGSTGDDVVMAIDGAQGRLFEVTDQLSGSLFSVNDISGIPIFEVFSDDTINIGTFNNEAIVVEGDTCTASGSFTGLMRAQDGLVGKPSIFFKDDTNTGFYRGTTDTISITTGGTQRGTINNNGWRVNNGALGVDVAASTTDGRIDAGNDIVAYSSDKRLKENIKLIEKPLDKLDKLSGFTFNWNEKAEEVAGFDREQSMVGVFAQDVESVLPQAVKRAPFDNDGKDGSLSGENYLTVQYEKLVPLLIESIKELKAEIEELKRRL